MNAGAIADINLPMQNQVVDRNEERGHGMIIRIIVGFDHGTEQTAHVISCLVLQLGLV
jgi:hypothetical protein